MIGVALLAMVMCNLFVTVSLTMLRGSSGHGTIVMPAMRANPSVENGYCPYCQGEMHQCDGDDTISIRKCEPPSPCWGATSAQTVAPSKFGTTLSSARHPDGSYWIDRNGGTVERPIWCPGDVIPIRYYINADHNGVFWWESQLAAPGEEKERPFRRFSERMSVNNYAQSVQYPNGTETIVQFANYFMAEDGVTEIPAGTCKGGTVWSEVKSHCIDNMFAATTLEIPPDMEIGETVLRWMWFGATDTTGAVVADAEAEKSLFVNCKDVIIGSPEQCASRHASFSV